MKRVFAILVILSLFSFCRPIPPALSLEELSSQEMRAVTGQAGISAAVDQGVLVIFSPTVTIWDSVTANRFGSTFTVKGHLSFETKALLEINENFTLDIGMPYKGQELTLTDQTGSGGVTRTFLHPLSNLIMIDLVQQSNDPFYTFSKNNISVYNHSIGNMSAIGDLNVAGFNLLESKASFFPLSGCGFRAVSGARAQLETLELESPDQQIRVSATGIMIGSAFTGDPLPEAPTSTNEIDTSTWAFDAGIFELGIPYYYHDDPEQTDMEIATYPFTLDPAGEESRPGEYGNFIAINAPIRGSIRIKNVSSSNFDMGPVAIDGIRLYKNSIEFPGRGIGN